MDGDGPPVVEVRVLQPGEARVLERVTEGVFDAPVRPAYARAFLAEPGHRIAVAVDDGTVVGMVTAARYLHPDKPPELWIDEVGVAPGVRGRGIGGRLMDAMLAEARAMGCREAWVLADPDNEAARRLYESRKGRGSTVAMYAWPVGE